jgi:site-specific DNA recombinase
VKSKYGTITREVPALVSHEVWQQAQQTIDHNRKLPKNQKYREYLLRGLIQCGLCGRNFVGQPINRKQNRVDFYYRCAGRSGSIHPEAKDRCRNRHVKAEWLEDLVWGDCQDFIANPGAALRLAKEQLAVRQEQSIDADQEKARLQKALAEKAWERDSILSLFRRKVITPDVAEQQLAEISQEETTLQRLLQEVRDQEAITVALADQYQQAETLLLSLQQDIGPDFDKKRQVVALLVRQITIGDMVHIDYMFDKGMFQSHTATSTETPRYPPGLAAPPCA